LQQWLQSGLWMSCRTRLTVVECVIYSILFDLFMLDGDIYIFSAWQRSLFHVFLVAQLSAILCLVVYFFSHNSEYKKYQSFSALISCGALITFAVYSYMVEYRFYQVSVSGIYEKHRGYSFYVAFCGFIFYFLSFCFSLAYAVCVLLIETMYVTKQQQFQQHYPSYSVPQLSQEDYFAMRSLPDTPHRQQFRSTGF
uniref:MARVEL domain-containing protein n=1 Tax=Heligmosomoides polygyrus TaxID=6339 RepID=A0A183FL19_HELPZ